MKAIVEAIGDVIAHPAVAAAVGAIVALRALPGANRAERLANASAGFAIAYFGGTALIEYLPIGSPRLASGVVFIVGAMGLVIFDAVISGIKRTDLAAWIMSNLPGRKGGQ